jgi:hypothetical protein
VLIRYPECEKLHVVKDESQSIGKFLEWLQGKYTICEKNEHIPTHPLYKPVRLDIEKELADYFGIDLDIVEKEKRQALEYLRSGYN